MLTKTLQPLPHSPLDQQGRLVRWRVGLTSPFNIGSLTHPSSPGEPAGAPTLLGTSGELGRRLEGSGDPYTPRTLTGYYNNEQCHSLDIIYIYNSTLPLHNTPYYPKD